NGPPDRELRLGFDTNARLLETVVLVFASGDQMVIHACQPARSTWICRPDRAWALDRERRLCRQSSASR
ncbi:MAG: hypothetical protein L0H64_23645, partial [Pseudonocardia sp.]|nr:hypothetical protein [Pseudonocardia sp.]